MPLTITWSPIYHPAWDATPEAYVAAGLVAWGRSRRLAKAEDRASRLRAYLGIQHDDPQRWSLTGAPRARFFLSLLLDGRTLSLRTYPELPLALGALRDFAAQLDAGIDAGPTVAS